jgi:hypothetical protein
MPPPSSHLANNDGPGVDADANGELHAIVALKPGVDSTHPVENAQTGVHGSHRVVFMGAGIAKVDEEAIAEILSDIALIALDNRSRRLLIDPHHLPQLFRVELSGEIRRSDEVAEHHRELPALRVRRGRLDGGG